MSYSERILQAFISYKEKIRSKLGHLASGAIYA
jgi:hypothetical protein